MPAPMILPITLHLSQSSRPITLHPNNDGFNYSMPPVSDNPVFMVGVITMFFGFLKVVAHLLYKSKCESYSICFGLCKSTRNINSELQLDLAEIAAQSAGNPPPVLDDNP